MTPVEELTAAVATLRNTAAAAMSGPWESLDNGDRIIRFRDVVGTFEHVVDEPVSHTGNAAWIALAHPGTAAPIAYWLETVAESMEVDGGMYQLCGADEHALKLARLINRSTP